MRRALRRLKSSIHGCGVVWRLPGWTSSSLVGPPARVGPLHHVLIVEPGDIIFLELGPGFPQGRLPFGFGRPAMVAWSLQGVRFAHAAHQSPRHSIVVHVAEKGMEGCKRGRVRTGCGVEPRKSLKSVAERLDLGSQTMTFRAA
jgi:hypothetical protein